LSRQNHNDETELWLALFDAEKVVLVETAVLEKAEQATMVLVRAGL